MNTFHRFKMIGGLTQHSATSEPYGEQRDIARTILVKAAFRFAVLFIVVTFFSQLEELVVEIFDLAGELFHLFTEAFEYTSEEILEHLFHAHHHESEIILFNVALLLVLVGLYFLYRAAPRLYRQWRRNRRAAWLRYKRQCVFAWRSLSRANKIIMATTYLSGIVLLLLLLTI